MDQHKTSKKRKLDCLLSKDEPSSAVLFPKQELDSLSSQNPNKIHKISPWKKVKIDSQLLSHVEGGFFSLEELDGQFYEGTPSALLEDLNESQHVEAISFADSSSKNSSPKDSKDHSLKTKKNKILKKPQFHQQKEQNSSTREPEKESHLIEKVTSFTLTDEEETLLVTKMSLWLEPYPKLHLCLLKGLYDLGFERPTPIQAQTLAPALRDRKDILGAAQTGSGKTLAFGLPILQQILEFKEKQSTISENNGDQNTQNSRHLMALILSPTRELAKQIVEHLTAVAKYTDIKIVPITGGVSPYKQERLLSKRPEIVVATPGRLWELIHQHDTFLNEIPKFGLPFLVFDEADRIVETGHFPEVEQIMNFIQQKNENFEDLNSSPTSLSTTTNTETQPNNESFEEEKSVSTEEKSDSVVNFVTSSQSSHRKKRQTFIFSATLTLSPEIRKQIGKLKRIRKFIKKSTKSQKVDPHNRLEKLMELIEFERKVTIVDLTNPQRLVADALKESKIFCLTEEKDMLLYYFIWKYPGRTLVFVNSIDCIRRLISILRLLQLNAWSLHANMQQKQRFKNLERFRATTNSVLVATDVMARGMDIPNIDHVIHYQIPRNSEIYIHRSGRTARASAEGLTVLFVDPSERNAYNNLCNTLRNGADLPDFPIDGAYFANIKKRVRIAVELNNLLHSIQKKKFKKNWLKKMAKEMDLDLSDSLESSSDSEDDSKRRQEQKIKNKIQTLKNQLKEILQKPVVPQGVSVKYYASTELPLLALQERPSAREDLVKKRSKAKKRQDTLNVRVPGMISTTSSATEDKNDTSSENSDNEN